MDGNRYLIPRNGGCPICHSMLIHIPPYYNCNECLSVFKFAGPMECGGDDDVVVILLNPKEGDHEQSRKTAAGESRKEEKSNL